MKNIFNFHPSETLLIVKGDSPIEELNSKDLLTEKMTELDREMPINKIQFLKQKKEKSLLHKSFNKIDENSFYANAKTPEKNLSFESFLEKGRQSQLKSNENRNKLKEMLEFCESMEVTSIPLVNKRNEKILENNSYVKKPVFSRLYENSSKPPRFLELSKQPEKSTNISRDTIKSLSHSFNKSLSEIDKSLYQDALRRIEKYKTKEFTKNLSFDLKEKRSSSFKEKSQCQTHLNLLNKLSKEIMEIAVKNLKMDPNNKALTYMQCLEIMHKMGYLKFHNVDPAKQIFLKNNNYFFEERSLLAQMWDLLRNSQKNTKIPEDNIEMDKFIEFLAIVEGFKVKNSNFVNCSQADEQGLLTFNRFDDDYFGNDYKGIHKEYEVFYRNRLSFKKMTPILKSEKKEISLSKKTKKLAVQHYKKLFETEESQEKRTIYDRLTKKHEVSQAKIAEKSLEQSQKILEKCTFKPEIHKRSHSMKQNKENALKISCKSKKTQENDIEKEKNECTFQPNLYKPNNFSQQPKIISQKLAFEQRKSIERMEQARIEKGFQKSLKERGFFSKNEILKDIGNLTVSNINPDLVKKYFGAQNKNNEKLNSSSLNKSINSSFNQITTTKNKNEQGYYTRMLQKEFESIKTQKTADYLKSDSINNETPILFLDINMGERKYEKINVFFNSDPIALAEEFCKKHNLKQSLSDKLKDRFSFEIGKKKHELSLIS